MSYYVKLAIGWSLYDEYDYVYLTNALDQNLYCIEGVKKAIVRRIANCVSIKELDETYGDVWKSFQEELESNYAIYYSETPQNTKTILDFGAKMASSSSYVIQPPRVSRLTVQINNWCDLNCSICNELTCFPCLSCSAGKHGISLSFDLIYEAIRFLSNFGIPELYLLGGDPLLDLALTKDVILLYKNYCVDGRVCILTNGLKILNLDESELQFLKDYASIFLIVTESNKNRIKEVIEKLVCYKVQFELQSRDLSDEMYLDAFHNDSFSYRRMYDRPLIERDNIIKPLNLYFNTVKDIHNPCYDGMVYIDAEGEVSVCKGYGSMFRDIKQLPWVSKLHALSKLWTQYPKDIVCNNCGLKDICVSCQIIKEQVRDSLIDESNSFCFTAR